MLTVNSSLARAARRATVVALALVLSAVVCLPAQAQFISRAVGGISVNSAGVLDSALLDDLGKLHQIRADALQEIPADLGAMTKMRKISLRRLELAIAESAKTGKQLPDEIRYLAGLQQIRYVLVYPERNDIILAGPAEGWKVDKRGNIVGITTGRPVMLLDDLLVAMRSARGAARNPISCSIDPTPEGMNRLRSHVSKLRTIGNPQRTAAGIAKVLGPQQISFTGVPGTSHFARVLVAADYRMKRLAMNFDAPPVSGLPSFMQMMKVSRTGMSNMLPRWWLEPNYEPLLRSEDGLAWELRGASVKAMTEQDFILASGEAQPTGKTSPTAQKWADNMTEKFDELAVADPVFGQLRNCMELAIVSALMVKERLTEKAGHNMPLLMDADQIETEAFAVPKQLDSQASLLKKGRKWIISASGGVAVNSWAIADNVEQSNRPAKARAKAITTESKNWWWN
jgi:hypothetical protein